MVISTLVSLIPFPHHYPKSSYRNIKYISNATVHMKKKESRRQIPTRISKHHGFMLFTFGLPSELRFFSSFAQFCSNLSMWSNPSLGELRKRDKKWPTAPFLYCFLYTFYPSWIKDESNLLQGPLSRSNAVKQCLLWRHYLVRLTMRSNIPTRSWAST